MKTVKVLNRGFDRRRKVNVLNIDIPHNDNLNYIGHFGYWNMKPDEVRTVAIFKVKLKK